MRRVRGAMARSVGPKQLIGISLVAALLTLGVQSRAEAVPTLTLHICQGLSCANFGPTPGFVTTSLPFTVGDYSLANASGSSFESTSLSQSITGSTQVQRIAGTSSAPLEIWLRAEGYLLPVGAATLDTTMAATKTGAATDKIDYQAYFNLGAPTGFPPSGPTSSPLISCTPAPGGTTSCNQDGVPVGIPAVSAPFTLTSVTRLNIAVDDRSLYGTSGQVSVTSASQPSQVPEAGTLLLLGTGLVGLGGYARHRLKRTK